MSAPSSDVVAVNTKEPTGAWGVHVIDLVAEYNPRLMPSSFNPQAPLAWAPLADPQLAGGPFVKFILHTSQPRGDEEAKEIVDRIWLVQICTEDRRIVSLDFFPLKPALTDKATGRLTLVKYVLQTSTPWMDGGEGQFHGPIDHYPTLFAMSNEGEGKQVGKWHLKHVAK